MKGVLETEYPVCNSAEEIEKRFLKIWGRITPEICKTYCGSYEKRLQAEIEANIQSINKGFFIYFFALQKARTHSTEEVICMYSNKLVLIILFKIPFAFSASGGNDKS